MIRRLKSHDADLQEAVALLRKGNLVAFPTETVYGLGAPLFSPQTIQKIFYVKGRPQDNPLIAHVFSMDDIDRIAHMESPFFLPLFQTFFPGPLTVILPKKLQVPSIVTAGREGIGVRMPNHPVARRFLEFLGEPLVAPSANLSGKPSSTCADHVIEDFGNSIEAVIDGGCCPLGIESTVISLCEKLPILLRPGTITKCAIESVLDCEIILPSEQDCKKPLSPGMKYRHYAPNAKVFLFDTLEKLKDYQTQIRKKTTTLFPTRENLYASLRRADQEDFEEILIFCDSNVQKDNALMNRLLKAAATSESGNF
jgi:L-threonylcarbamoyladenylate synthase